MLFRSVAAGDVREGYAWHKSAIGLATGIEVKTDVNWKIGRASCRERV